MPTDAPHQGNPIPRPQRHNYKKSMEMVGPVGLEPDDVGWGLSARLPESSHAELDMAI